MSEGTHARALEKVRIELHFHLVRHGARSLRFGACARAAATSAHRKRLVLKEATGRIVACQHVKVALESEHRENSKQGPECARRIVESSFDVPSICSVITDVITLRMSTVVALDLPMRYVEVSNGCVKSPQSGKFARARTS